MIGNYIKISIRNIFRQKFYSFINLAGLTIGLTASLLILLFIVDEFSYDRFHIHANDIYRVNLEAKLGEQEMKVSFTSAPLAAGFLDEFPEIEDACRISIDNDINIRKENDVFTEKKALLADNNFFDFFSFKLIQGDPQTVLSKPNSVVLTESAAIKIFGYTGKNDDTAIGQNLIIGTDREIYSVSGIMENPPHNSHFQFSIVLPMDSWEMSKTNNWLNNILVSYIRLNKNSDNKTVDDKMPDLVMKYVGPQVQDAIGIPVEEFFDGGGKYGFYLEPMLNIHLSSTTDMDLEPGGSLGTIYLFGGISIFILVIACINFMNLATARYTNRAKEVGVRKSIGAYRKQLIMQFINESIFYTIIAMVLSLVILSLVLPQFNVLSGKALFFRTLLNPYYFIGIITIVGLVGFLAGSYPAFYLTAFKPVDVLRGRIKAGMKSSGIRSGLVVFQLIISIALITCTLLMNKQLNYVKNVDLGLDTENVMVISNANELGTSKITFKEELLELPGVKSTSISLLVPPSVNYSSVWMPMTDNPQNMGFNYDIVDEDHLETLGLEMVEGRFFSKDFPSDSSAIILNEAALRLIGWDNGVGETIKSFFDENKDTLLNVIGVVKDYNFQSLKKDISSLVLLPGSDGNFITIKLEPGNVNDKISAIETVWNSFTDNSSFDYSFMKDDFDASFRLENRLGKIFLLFTGLAILIACLGLIGLSSFTAERRSKEIGIRKSMGSTTKGVITLLSREYIKLIIISFVIAAPLSYIVINWWLQNFAYKINIGAISFVFGGLITLVIAVLCVGYQSVRAALKNPVDSLRYE